MFPLILYMARVGSNDTWVLSLACLLVSMELNRVIYTHEECYTLGSFAGFFVLFGGGVFLTNIIHC